MISMIKKHLTLLALSLLVICGVGAQDFPERPNPPKLVNDLANIFTPDQVAALEWKLNNYNDSTSTQIAVVTMKSTGDYEIKDYAQRLGQQWGIGQKDKNNGIVLLVAVEDRKVTIQTGYGLEGAVTDAGTKRIIETIIKPYFKEQQYFAGVDAGTTALIQLAKGEFKGDPKTKVKGKGIPKRFIIIGLIILVYIIFKSMRNGGGGRGGRFSSGGFVEGALLGSLLGGGGRGSSWGGGGGGGGGFGGFGGGGFGGGGSSGDW